MHAELMPEDEMRAKEAALMIWNHSPDAASMQDPRSGPFAHAFLAELADMLRAIPAAIRSAMEGAAKAAETMNVAKFQGLIECVQNADDVCATEVRFAIRIVGEVRQLLIVHDGQPVTFHHVLSMALPFLTTKTNRHDQRGRFGIGLKTLKRIAHKVAIHSAPYHFSGDLLSFGLVEPEVLLPGFYDPERDTMIAVTLRDDVSEEDLQEWFDQWHEDGLIFLSSVRCFRQSTIEGKTLKERILHFGGWENPSFEFSSPDIIGLQSRRVQGNQQAWTVWKATIRVPGDKAPTNKARTKTTVVAIAVSEKPSAGGVYIGFKTRIPSAIPFSLDAQFDPGTSRESMIENAWNEWLIAQCGVLLGEVAVGLLKTLPQAAWYMVPLAEESVAAIDDLWLGRHFRQSFGSARDAVGTRGLLPVHDNLVGLEEIAFAHSGIDDLIDDADIQRLYPDKRPLPRVVRGSDARWRAVLEELDLSTVVDTTDLLEGFKGGMFHGHLPEWWVRAGRAIIEDLGNDEETAPFGIPFLMAENGASIACTQAGTTVRPLILIEEISRFAAQWELYQRLHEVYRKGEDAQIVLKWLVAEAAFTRALDAAADMAAFAETFALAPIYLEDEALRYLRDRFDEVAPEKAPGLGLVVGRAILLDCSAYGRDGKVQKERVSPAHAYLSKTLDGEHGYWPVAAGNTPGLHWISSRYDEQLRLGSRATRKRTSDGPIARGPRKFLMLLGAATTPRLVRTGLSHWGGKSRNLEFARSQASG
jgi:hypothetical protein